MKTRIKTLGCLCIAIIVSGCAKEIVSSFKDRGKMIEHSYLISIENKTKTSFSENKVSWEVGDMINYYSADGNMPGTEIVQAKGETTTIKAVIGESDEYFIAYYGEGICLDNFGQGFVLQGAISSEQDGTFAKAHISAAKSSDVKAASLTFNNISSLVKFTIDRNDVKYMTFTANDGTKIYGDIQVDFDTQNKPSAKFLEEGGGSYIKVNTGLKAGTYYLSTLPVTIKNGFTCTFYNESEKKIGFAKTEKDFVIRPNAIIDLGKLDLRIMPEAEDLSKEECANCYLVNEINDYKFNARFKGNSTEPIGDVSSVKVLWETNNTNHSPGQKGVIKDVEYVNGYIKFTPVANGSASIAALDSENNILWSWHIWVCLGYDAYNSGQDYQYLKNAGTAEEEKITIGRFMDRNLGALSNVPGDPLVYGMMYEWGRKDPFLGSNTTSTIVWTNEESTETTGTVEWATAHPTNFLYGTSSSNRDWLYSNHDDTLWGSEKTKYDPCPPGWRVPDGSTWALAFGYEDTCVGVYDNTHYGMQFGGKLGPAASIWYPAAGYRDPGEKTKGIPQNFGRYGFWWSCSNGTNDESYIFKLYFTNDFTPKSTSKRSYGFSVRCVSTYTPPAPEPVPVESIEIIPSALDLELYHSEQLSCKILPENADHKTVTWSSSDDFIATVDQCGIVTAKSTGQCVITVKSVDGPESTCTINVETAGEVDLSEKGTANCYLVTTPGLYKFKADVKGNSTESIGNGVKARVLWETYGTNFPLYPGTIVFNPTYSNGYISFQIPINMQSGNAVIAVVDKNEKILWSWHIWVFKGYDMEKKAQTYYNGAEMMSCNLGAVSEEKGNAQNMGLLYQWGRKDPFLASGMMTSDTEAASTLNWPSPIASASIEYSIEHPTTFILGDLKNRDWAENDNTRWASTKTKYDPCPVGWKVPDGGASGVWSMGNKYYPSLSIPKKDGIWIESMYGYELAGIFGDDASIWYPSSEYRSVNDGKIYGYTMYGMVWSATTSEKKANNLYLNKGSLLLSNSSAKATGMAVRCIREGSYTGIPLRGISIYNESGDMYLEENGQSVVLEAILNPQNASYRDVQWDIIDSDKVSLATDGTKATITRVCEDDSPYPILIMVSSLDGDFYEYYEIYCCSDNE